MFFKIVTILLLLIVIVSVVAGKGGGSASRRQPTGERLRTAMLRAAMVLLLVGVVALTAHLSMS